MGFKRSTSKSTVHYRSCSSIPTCFYSLRKPRRYAKPTWLLLAVLLTVVFVVIGVHHAFKFLFSTVTRRPKGVYSSHSIDIKSSIPNATIQLLQQNPQKFWDCNLAATICRYFNPHQFIQQHPKFEPIHNNNLPAMTALSWSHSASTASITTTLSFIHIHKAGGTTVKMILAQANQALNKRQHLQAEISTYKYSFGGGSKAQKERNQQRRQDHIDQMMIMQQQQHPLQSVVFTVVRDPLERFVSAVQQVMHYNDDFRRQCLKWTAKATLQCAIDYTQHQKYLHDVHLLPMVTHFRLWDQFDANLAVIHLQDLPALAEYFRLMVLANINNHTTTATSNNSVIQIPHGRDRSQKDYATSNVLAKMNIQQHTTPKMIHQLCQIYAIDVAFLAVIGYPTSYCTTTTTT